MIQGILTFQFILNQKETGEIEPEFKPIKLEFHNDKFSDKSYSELIVMNDIFAIFYQHTTGVSAGKGSFGNFYSGRLKATPYQVISYYRQEADGSQFLTFAIFELDDELDIFQEIIEKMGQRLEPTFESLAKAKNLRQLNIIEKLITKIEGELKFSIFKVDRLARLDKIQKAALIFHGEERIKILETLRENPIPKKDLKNILERIKPNPNVDVLIEPFLELNLIRRDWIKGERDKKTGVITNQGEYLFLIKDIVLARFPHEETLNRLKESQKSFLFSKYTENVEKFFTNYDINKQTVDETRKLASALLNPDVYDFLALMKSNYYPLDKIPKIFSEFADSDVILDNLEALNIITKITDDNKQVWVLLLTDIRPIIVFPEYLLPKIRASYQSKDPERKITYEIAKKALELLEVTYPEQVEF